MSGGDVPVAPPERNNKSTTNGIIEDSIYLFLLCVLTGSLCVSSSDATVFFFEIELDTGLLMNDFISDGLALTGKLADCISGYKWWFKIQLAECKSKSNRQMIEVAIFAACILQRYISFFLQLLP